MPSGNAKQHNAEGLEHLQNNELEKAITSFAMAVELDPEFGQAWFGKGTAHAELREYEDAIHAYQQSIRFAGDKAALPLFNLGNLYQELGENGEAARLFHLAVKEDPTMADAWINLGRILDDSGNHTTAIECYDIALQIEPTDTTAWSNRGNSFRGRDEFEEAIASYEKALEFDASNLAARLGRGGCLVDCGKAEEGLVALQTTVEESQHPLALFEFGTALAKIGEHQKAIVMYDTLIENSFETAEVWNNRGECLAKMDQIDKALSSFDNAMQLDERYAPALFGKARVLANAQRLDEARAVTEVYLGMIDENQKADSSVQALVALCGLS